MKLLANENFPRSAVEALRAAGFDVVWVREQMPGAKDEDVLANAMSDGRLLVTFDKDFGELAFRCGLPSTCGVVLFRVATRSPDYIAEKVRTILQSRNDWVGQFAVVDEIRVRMRNLPTLDTEEKS
jgi:predicted nuclease of predicted toxin-antitoxin system